MPIDPSRFELLLAGPRVHRMVPLLAARGFRAQGFEHGEDALRALAHHPFHVMVLELEIEDIDPRALLDRARVLAPTTRYVLLDDPARTHLIVATLVRGVDAYVPTPPDERVLLDTLVQQGCFCEVLRAGGLEGVRAESDALRQRIASLEAELVRVHQENALLSAEVADLNESLEEALRERREARTEVERRAAPPPAAAPVEEEVLILDEDDADADDGELLAILDEATSDGGTLVTLDAAPAPAGDDEITAAIAAFDESAVAASAIPPEGNEESREDDAIEAAIAAVSAPVTPDAPPIAPASHRRLELFDVIADTEHGAELEGPPTTALRLDEVRSILATADEADDPAADADSWEDEETLALPIGPAGADPAVLPFEGDLDADAAGFDNLPDTDATGAALRHVDRADDLEGELEDDLDIDIED